MEGPGAAARTARSRRSPSPEDLLPALRSRQPTAAVRAIGRAISLVEAGGPAARELVRALYPETGRAAVVGLTGPSGVGKSTLVDRLARHLRETGETVGVLAIDPTSPFTGGALLGDRIRMQALYTDPGVFIRSMATRGEMGGLARAAHDALDVLDAAGFGRVLLETVGVGQDEVDVVRSVDTVVVVVVPGLGDDIQAAKAGLMEIADVFVVNKADREGADRLVAELEQMLALAGPSGTSEGGGWRPPVVSTVATRGEGVGELAAAVAAHREWLVDGGRLAARRRGHLRLRVEAILEERILAAARAHGLEEGVETAYADRTDPYTLADRLFEAAGRQRGDEGGERDAGDEEERR